MLSLSSGGSSSKKIRKASETQYYETSPLGDIVYVATEDNYIYAVDAETGIILQSRSLGYYPVGKFGCDNNAPTVGVNSTPVIDPESGALFVISYADTGEGPAYFLHKISTETLDEFPESPMQIGSPVQIADSVTLPGGSKVLFDASKQRQRASLLLKGHELYAAFASFCDQHNASARGWLMGWNTDTLQSLHTDNGLLFHFVPNKRYTSSDGLYLSSIWMSGAGLASDETGDIYFLTGNSSKDKGIPRGATSNLDQSFIRLSPSSGGVMSFFTPANADYMNEKDRDFGSGGPLLVPEQIEGLPKHLALAAGKEGRLFLLNRDSLGGFRMGPRGTDNILASQMVSDPINLEECRCSPVFFHTNRPYVAIGSGSAISLLALANEIDHPLLPLAKYTFPPLANNQFGIGVTVSSNGENDAIIWAVSRPIDPKFPQINLYAFALEENPTPTLRLLKRVAAGVWAFPNAGTGALPVVANGKVFVASTGQLRRFGMVSRNVSITPDLGESTVTAQGLGGAIAESPMAPVEFPTPPDAPTRMTGQIIEMLAGRIIILESRDKQRLVVNASTATKNGFIPVVLQRGSYVMVLGRLQKDKQGRPVLGASYINRASNMTAGWLPDIGFPSAQ